uniref:Membrane-anchored junction protein n=1 Tax=Monopterus albus TaxID=43700 RepID=A0A3Q3K1D9_MONAL|nr:membrane-anchored junction protein [Monopterus albus]XP_020465823.1 membrane-anchored junction protein [Monopterus albus]
MSLQAFSFPFPETRFFRAGCLIYKFKIRGGSSYSGEELMGGNCYDQELEDIIRTVLGNLNSLQPFTSTHFNVFPYRRRWEGVSEVMCRHGETKLRAYPFILILYVEKNTQNGKQAKEKLNPDKEVSQHLPCVSEPQSKRCKRDSPLEEAKLKDLIKDLVDEIKMTVGQLHMDKPHSEREVLEDPGHADKKRIHRFNKPNLHSGVRDSESPGKVHPGTTWDGEEEEEGGEEGEDVDSAPGIPVRPGILTRLASHIFPFSLFFRDH